MSRVAALTGRELRSFFLSPAGYIIIAVFMLMTGIIFAARVFHSGQPASMRAVFEWGTWMLLFICPAISMKAISEERRLGTIEMLMTSPVSNTQIVLGKFLGAWMFLVLLLVPTIIFVIVLELHGRPDYGELASGYLGMLLIGAAYLASGIFASTLTAAQVVAFLVTMFFWIALSAGAKILPLYAGEPWAAAAYAADPDPRLRDFAIGLIDSSNIVYFAGIALAFLLASTRSLEAGRWR